MSLETIREEKAMEEKYESILNSMKKMLGPTIEQYNIFDVDLIIIINSVFSTLFQLGVGPQNAPFTISSELETWSNFLPDSAASIAMVKSYMYLRLKLLFDPPSSGFVLDSYKAQIAEFEWRANVMEETP